MKERGAIVIATGLISLVASAGAYDFSAADKLLTDNLTSAFRGGVVCLAARDGQLIYTKELGDLNRNSRAQIASATKTFSGALVLALCDAGIISLDDSVGKYLPIYTDNNKNKFTIRNCFSHTAGWRTDSKGYLNSTTLTLQQFADSVAINYPFAYDPGTAFCYTGVAMQIAGAMVEKAANASWNSLFKTYIADKCSLTTTDYCLSSPDGPRIAGGICSTPDDIMRFASMILNKGVFHGTRVVSEAGIAEMWQDQTNRLNQISSPYPPSPKWNNPYSADIIYYGIGDWLDVQNSTTGYVEQISGAGAFGTVFWIDRCRGITGVVFTQSLYSATWPTEFQVIDAIRGQVGGGCGTTVTVPVSTTGQRCPALTVRGKVVTLSAARASGYRVEVLDCRGKVVARTVREFGAPAGMQSWTLPQLPSGAYLVRASGNGESITTSVVES